MGMESSYSGNLQRWGSLVGLATLSELALARADMQTLGGGLEGVFFFWKSTMVWVTGLASLL